MAEDVGNKSDGEAKSGGKSGGSESTKRSPSQSSDYDIITTVPELEKVAKDLIDGFKAQTTDYNNLKIQVAELCALLRTVSNNNNNITIAEVQ